MVTKRALLVGCNYTNNPDVPEEYKLYGCINDVKAMHDLILEPRFGFQDITILTDEPVTAKAPTSSIIIEELETKVNATKPGDTLLFFFSGGGELVNPMAMDSATAMDTATDTVITATATANATATGSSTATATATASPTATSTAAKTKPTPTPMPRATADTKKGMSAIIPCDLKPITAADILPIINRLLDKAIFIFVSDSSYSGGLFKESVQIHHNVPDPGPNYHRKTIPSNLLGPSNVGQKSAAGISLNAKILFSSSKANEESVEVYPEGDRTMAFGEFSNFIKTLNPSVPVFDILGFHQHPYLDYCME